MNRVIETGEFELLTLKEKLNCVSVMLPTENDLNLHLRLSWPGGSFS